MKLLNQIPFLLFSNLAASEEKNLWVTDYVGHLSKLNSFLMICSFISCLLILVAFIYFGFRYRRTSEQEQGRASVFHSNWMEFTWSFIPFVIFMVVFVWGCLLYNDLKTVPANSLEIHVYGQKWSWNFVYKNGRKTSNEFYAPVGRPVKLIMTSRDVIHSFSIPSFKIKQDVVPGMYTSLWFQANKEGNFQVFCTEFCGTGHAAMLAKVRVVSLKEFEDWLKNDPYKGLSLAEIGEKYFQGRCTACHKTTKEKMIGPGLLGIFNSQRSLADGSRVIADENYLRESILNPSVKLVSGFANQMTPFAGLLSEEELSGLIEYIKTLKE